MAAPPLFPSRVTAIHLFFTIALAGISLALFTISHLSEQIYGVGHPLYYGKKSSMHVTPKSLTGNAPLDADFAAAYVASLAARELRETGQTQYP